MGLCALVFHLILKRKNINLAMLESGSQSNKRIVKNTVLLYIRMFITMAISFFTTRILINALGIEDYGINNFVAGFASLFASKSLWQKDFYTH